ncbi:MAG: hypothetical protein K0V04_11330 [Deltaproteobacteria bacterium]|nr:hypothetical protein [Deltaproteobacteria bacterium]
MSPPDPLPADRRLARIHAALETTPAFAVPHGDHLRTIDAGHLRPRELAPLIIDLIDPQHSLLLLVIEGFLGPEHRRHLRDALAPRTTREHASVRDLTMLDAPTYFQLRDAPGLRRRYFDHAPRARRELAAWSDPHCSPFERVFEWLGHSWPGGTQIATEGPAQPTMVPFSVRNWRQGAGCVGMHVDQLRFDAEHELPITRRQAGQLSWNVVLETSTAGHGGETVMHDLGINAKQEWQRRLRDRSDHELGPDQAAEACRYHCPPGSLNLLASNVVHRTTPALDRHRLTVSGFAAIPNHPHVPIALWS